MLYFLRKPWSTCKLAIGEDLNLDLKSLGAVDTGFLVAYALGQIFLSPLGDMYGPRYMITAVLMGSGLLCAVLSSSYNFNVIALAWTANGAFQALAFPLMMKALSPWFPSHIRGKVFGLWTTSQGIGGVLAVSFGGYVADSSLSWRGAFAVRIRVSARKTHVLAATHSFKTLSRSQHIGTCVCLCFCRYDRVLRNDRCTEKYNHHNNKCNSKINSPKQQW